jgi:L-amino acid N-acyltransferase YncA
MDKNEDGFEWYTRIPLNYFRDKHGREYICHFGSEKELGGIYKMYCEFEPKRSIMGVPPSDTEELEKWVRHFFGEDTKNLVVIDPDSKIVGHAALFPMSEHCCEYFMALLPTNQSAGIGRLLCVSVIEAAKYLDFRRVWICVEKSNFKAIQLHKKLGYKTVGGGLGDDYEFEIMVDEFVEC